MNRALHPLRALLLAATFVAGNLVLPEVDVFLDHGLTAPRTEHQVHLERPGGCRDHAEHCVLSRLLSDLRLQAPAAGAALIDLGSLNSTPRRPASQPSLRSAPSAYHSRAPPAPPS